MPSILIKGPAKTDYEVVIEKNFENLEDNLKKIDCVKKKVCIVSDSTVMPIYGDEIKAAFEKLGCQVDTMILEPGEVSKSVEDLIPCYRELMSKFYTRKDYIVALGGGCVIDYAGFIASSYMRGMNLINLPTSLMAMADGSVGGKVGIDFMGYKNMIGTYYNPRLVYANVACINTLEEIHYYSGFAEIMKTAIIKSSSVYEWLIEKLYEISDKETDIICDMIEQTINISKIYIEKDPFNVAERQVLNLGHTVGHALEKAKNYTMSHGECIALGIIAAAHISYKREMLSLDEYLEIRDMFVPFNLPITIEDIDIDSIIEDIKHDKKQSDGFCFILLKKIGKAVVDNNVTEDEIRAALEEIRFSDDDLME